MPSRKIVQDIVPNGRRTIRKVSITREKKPVRVVEERAMEEEVEIEEKIIPKKIKTEKKPGSSKYLLSFIVIFIALVVIAVALSLLYSKAVVTISPKIVSLNINGTFTAKKSLPATSDDLSYEVISATDIAREIIPAAKGALVQTKAKGTVIIYNDHSSASQILVAGTRLVGSSGLIYRTISTVSVPGKKTTPGSISIGVIADHAGENYNIKSTNLKGDFTLPGYKGTDKYNTFYARLKTDITGGFSGNKMTIDPNAESLSIKTLEETLKAKLIAKLNEDTTKENILFNNSYSFEFERTEPVMQGTTTAEITVRATAYAVIFNSNSLIKYIAGKEIKKFPSDTYSIDGDRELVFKISNIKDFSAKKGTSLIFTISGPVKITGTFSESKLKEELKGIKLVDSNAVFAKYASIANAYTLITPFWLRSFPDSVDKISIEYKY